MGFIAESRRQNLWFGTEERMEWFKTPSSGADTSPVGWNSEGTTLNGDGYAFGSFGSHKVYQFDWGSSNAREVAQRMKSYADGTYGRGYIYFVDPTLYELNILPAAWADPSMGIDYEGNAIVAGVEPTGVPTGANTNDLPVTSAQFNLASTAVGFRGKPQAVFIPIPDNHTLMMGAVYSSTGSGGVFMSPLLSTGAIGAPVKLTEQGINASPLTVDDINGIRGVWLWIGKTAAGAATVTIRGIAARLVSNNTMSNNPAKVQLIRSKPWVGGMGNSGCRFVGKPTFIERSELDRVLGDSQRGGELAWGSNSK